MTDRDIVSTRVLDASRDRVFEAFSDPARVARWWGPSGVTNTFEEFDFRRQGAWRFVMHLPGGVDLRLEYVFLEVVAPERIVFRHLSTVHPFEMTITLEDEGGATRVTWRMRHATAEECAKVKDVVMRANEENLDRLAAELRA